MGYETNICFRRESYIETCGWFRSRLFLWEIKSFLSFLKKMRVKIFRGTWRVWFRMFFFVLSNSIFILDQMKTFVTVNQIIVCFEIILEHSTRETKWYLSWWFASQYIDMVRFLPPEPGCLYDEVCLDLLHSDWGYIDVLLIIIL